MSDAKPEEAVSNKPVKARGNGLVIVLIGVNTLVSAGGIAFAVLRPPPPPVMVTAAGVPVASAPAPAAVHEDKSESKSEGKGEGGDGKDLETSHMMRVEDLVVHLRNPEVDRYARLELDIELDSATALQRLEARRAAVRDAVISYMSERTYEELRGQNGIASLKTAIRGQIEPMAAGHVSGLFVTSFVVQ
ncbi:MAG TPA: flagellar basal body-associated FliL family protein [Myxococcota bacterium]|jgi:flagellar FliL protein